MKRYLLSTAALLALVALPAQAQLFGPSDEEKAAAKAHEDGQDAGIQQNARSLEDTNARLRQAQEQSQSQIRDLNDRVRSLTDSLARATGTNEELSHQISLLNARMDQQQKDFNYRLCTLSAQNLGADAGTLNCAAAGAGAGPVRPGTQAQVVPGAALAPLGDDNVGPGRAPGVLGSLPAAPPPRLTSRDGGSDSRQFDSAMNLLARAQYPEASAAFRAYADTHPDDDKLSPQALYWVGSIAMMSQDNAAAARAFAEDLKKYPKSSRAGDAMLKMGQALVAQGQTSNGCTAFRAVTRKQYPDASPSTIDAALAARKANNCR
ncbi:MAG: tetratricopeptide repeat protein [Alphaproteobacteria bacterium]|nr:tetratricopeptide repeat protein [Alphaproteobacteria bacterium]